jgi:hypothetical protein
MIESEAGVHRVDIDRQVAMSQPQNVRAMAALSN